MVVKCDALDEGDGRKLEGDLVVCVKTKKEGPKKVKRRGEGKKTARRLAVDGRRVQLTLAGNLLGWEGRWKGH